METLAGLLFCNVFIVPGVVIAVVLLCGHGADLIAGYNTASPAEKAKWDRKALCRGVGALLLVLMACLEVTVVGGVLGILPLLWSGLALFLAAVAAGVLWINKSKRFKTKQ